MTEITAAWDEMRTIAQRKNNPAEYMHERMMRMIANQQAALSADQELGVLVTGGSAPSVVIIAMPKLGEKAYRIGFTTKLAE